MYQTHTQIDLSSNKTSPVTCPESGSVIEIKGFRGDCEIMARAIARNPAAVFTFYKVRGVWFVSYALSHNLDSETEADPVASHLLRTGNLTGLADLYHSADLWVYGRQVDGSYSSRLARGSRG